MGGASDGSWAGPVGAVEVGFVPLSMADTCSRHHHHITRGRKKGGVATLPATTDGPVWKHQRGKITPKPQALISGTPVLSRAPADYWANTPHSTPTTGCGAAIYGAAPSRRISQMCVLIAEYERVRLFRTRPLLQEWLLLSSSAQKSAASSNLLPARLRPAKRRSGAGILRGGAVNDLHHRLLQLCRVT